MHSEKWNLICMSFIRLYIYNGVAAAMLVQKLPEQC
jgi:hypothetical protein